MLAGKNRALSLMNAILILVVIAVVAFAIINLGSITQRGPPVTRVIIENVQFGQDMFGRLAYDGLEVTVQNTGTVTVRIQALYVYNGSEEVIMWNNIGLVLGASDADMLGFADDTALWNFLLPHMDPLPYTNARVGSSGVTTTWSTSTADLSVSIAYTIKVVTDNGFTVQDTFYTPDSFL
ncbi:MAG: hypothetical protein QG670_2833 [Thermoproteota archaeon]|nr:hypothetical protein [Thermoproteota archaeon]